MAVCIVHWCAPEIVKKRSRYFIGAKNILVQRNGWYIVVYEITINTVKIHDTSNQTDRSIRIDVITLFTIAVTVAVAAMFGV